MLLIQTNSKQQVGKVLVLVIAIFLTTAQLVLGEKTEYKMPKSRTFIIGSPTDPSSVLELDLEKENVYFNYIKEGKMLYKSGQYKEAQVVLEKGLSYALSNDIYPWNLRWRLADVYEAMGDKEKFLKEIDWLIAHCKNAKTKQKFLERKDRFLKK